MGLGIKSGDWELDLILDWGSGIAIGDWNWGLGWKDWGLGLGIVSGDCDWGLGLVIGIEDWER